MAAEREIIDGLQDDIADITVQINYRPLKLVSVNLNLKDNLSKIRKRLEQNSKIKMNDTLSFVNKIGQIKNDSSTGSAMAEIAREDEERIILEKIIEKKSKFLYLNLNSEPDWKFLKDKLKLEYGRTVNLEKANKKAFTIIEDCEMTVIGAEGYKKETIDIDLRKDQIIEKDLLLTADANVQNFAKLGVSFGNSKFTKSNFGTN